MNPLGKGDGRPEWRWAGIAWLLAQTCTAGPQLELKLDHLRYGQVAFEDVVASLTSPQGYRLALGRLELPFAPWRVDHLILDCLAGRLTVSVLECGQGRLALRLPHLDQTLSASASFALSPAQGQLRLDPTRFAGGRLRLQAEYQGKRWQTKLQALRQPLMLDWIKSLFPRLSWLAQLKGNITFELDTGGRVTLDHLHLDLDGKNLSFNDLDYRRAVERLQVGLRLEGQRRKDLSTLLLDLEIPAGEGLYFPVYLPFSDHPTKLKTCLILRERSARILFHDLELSQQGVLTAAAEGRLDHSILSLAARFQADLPALFRLYGQPFLEGGRWEGIHFQSGTASGRLVIADRLGSRAQIQLERAVLSDRQRRFGLDQLNASLIWQKSHSPTSHLHWRAGHLYAIPVGSAELFFRLSDDDFSLVLPADLPVLDGHFFLDQLEVLDLSTAPQVQFRGRLDQISLELLTRVLGWPPLAGTLSGTIPQVSYDHRQRTLRLEGRLTVEAFDGNMSIEHLVITDLFGPLPRLRADVRFHGLDLEQITGRFAFGRITGRLEGQINRLELENWQPVSFDAWFGTPSGDRTRHRISQKAVENLSKLGGGFAAGLLSRTLLRTFEEFGYTRLGFGCRLKEGVCELSGVAPAAGGYHIVKGGGLPRIDVIGYNRRIDWKTLMTRLARITRPESPVIQP